MCSWISLSRSVVLYSILSFFTIGFFSFSHSAANLANAEELREVGENCGRSGSTEDRLDDCDEEIVAKDGYVWRLHTRFKGVEIWRDETSELSWSQVLPKRKAWRDLMEVYNGEDADLYEPELDGYIYAEKKPQYCRAQSSLRARGDLRNIPWWLPSADDFSLAEAHGIREVLPYMSEENFWSTSAPHNEEDGMFFHGPSGTIRTEFRSSGEAVVCIAH